MPPADQICIYKDVKNTVEYILRKSFEDVQIKQPIGYCKTCSGVSEKCFSYIPLNKIYKEND